MDKLELWGGAECTVNRVGDCFRDQIEETGHRPGDLDLFAGLGLAALRYPILWERVSPDCPDSQDWNWTDAGLARLRELGIRPIAGLVHHGSGPRYTDLLSEDFAPGVARFAAEAARRYDWITDWTPINEPVTTARFSALYGHWYPHRRDEKDFWLALLNQIDATRFAMNAIRAVQPHARLIQTDDLGRTYATVALRQQAAFDNVRRWMGWDLLAGRVVPGHDLWRRLVAMGLEDRLRAIADDPCPPDIIGINHYLTSDRFLDHRVHRYPAPLRGGNGRSVYTDTEAVRVLTPPPTGLEGALREAWARYGIPLAITEVHNGCTREEQMRWMVDAWRLAEDLKVESIDVRAVTSWALIGSSGWDTLLTGAGRYEPGAFDVSGGIPRPTALASLLTDLAAARTPEHPILAGAGWWRRPTRLHHAPVPRPALLRQHKRGWTRLADDVRPLLVTGATGTLGRALVEACRQREIVHVLTSRCELDLGDPDSVERALDRYRPWAVINAAGWVRVDDAEDDADSCLKANGEGAAILAGACAQRGIPTVNFSSDLVFDGTAGRAYVEDDLPAPLNVYGRSKADAERRIAELPGEHLVIRTAAFFSPFDTHNFAMHLVAVLGRDETFRAARDQIISPTYVPDLCNATLDLLIDQETGIWHLTNGEALDWADFGRSIAVACGLNPDRVEGVAGSELGWRAARPRSAALASGKGRLLPPLSHAINRFVQNLTASGALNLRAAA